MEKERMTRTSRKETDDKRKRISERMIFYAGLGALCDQSPEEFEVLIAKGQKQEAQFHEGEGVSVPTVVEERQFVVRWLPHKPGDKGVVAFARHSDAPAVEEREPEDPPSRMKEIIESMVSPSVPTAPAVLQARRNSAARTALIEEFGLLASTQVAELSQSQAENRAALASRWKREGKIFSVRHHAKDYFPGFQFEANGQPREAIAAVLDALGGAHGWETALWFTGANGYLEGLRPVDLLESKPDAVIEAAKHEGDETYF